MSKLEQEVGSLVGIGQQVFNLADTQYKQLDARIAQKETDVDQFLKNATPETRYQQDITIGGSKDYLYPIWWAFPDLSSGVNNLTITRSFSWNGGDGQRPLNPSSIHQAALLLEMEGDSTQWHGDLNFLEVKRYFKRYNATASHLAFAMYTKAEKIDPAQGIYGNIAENTLNANCPGYSGVYLRGGGLGYRIIKNWKGDVNFHDGSDNLRRNITVSGNTRWYAEPIPIADISEPTIQTNAYVDPT